jgi:pilus assembly protein CpaB
MNRQTLLIVFGGFFSAVLVAIVVQIAIGSKQDKVVAENKKSLETTYVLVASTNLDKGSNLKEGNLKWQEWPKAAVFKGAIERENADQKPEDVFSEGMIRRDVKAGEPIMETTLIPEKVDNFLSASLGEGKRAVAITVNAASSVGGFVTPGDYVDIILTYDLRLPSDKEIRNTAAEVVSKKAVQTVLQNIKVIANDQNMTKQDKAKVSRTITVEVDLRQAEVLALAGTMGKLSLSLRRYGDEEIISTQPEVAPAITDLRLSTVMQEVFHTSYKKRAHELNMMKNQHHKNNTRPNKRTMRIYNGVTTSNVTLN